MMDLYWATTITVALSQDAHDPLYRAPASFRIQIPYLIGVHRENLKCLCQRKIIIIVRLIIHLDPQ